MNKLCQLLKYETEDELFTYITSTFKEKITKWDYFVNWKKVLKNVEPLKVELNLLNSVVGSQNIEQDLYKIIKKYPEVIETFPLLLAIRADSVDILIDTQNFIYTHFDFTKRNLTDSDCKELASFIMQAGLGKLLQDRNIKNLVDYATGVEVGLDSNGRKNRGGTLMEEIVREFVEEVCTKKGLQYMEQATATRIKKEWGIDMQVDKSSRRIDFAINKKGKLYFIEVNFYGGGGSKLKSTATEYSKMNDYWNQQGIEFIWITDGKGWESTLKPLREYFDKANYLVNLELLTTGILSSIIDA